MIVNRTEKITGSVHSKREGTITSIAIKDYNGGSPYAKQPTQGSNCQL
jgi:hypothetical protein